MNRQMTCFSAVSASLLLACAAHAQVLGTISASSTQIKVGEPVTITANIDIVSGNYCGFVVGFGDGTFKDAVSDVNNPVPLVITRTFDKPGSYHVTLGGKNVQNRPNCGGPERAVDITVTGSSHGRNACQTRRAVRKTLEDSPASSNAKTGAFTCTAKPGTTLPATKPVCKGDLSYFENTKKGQFGCKP